MLELIVGIDIGGTSTKFGLVDTAGKVRIHSSIATDNPDINVYIKDLAKAIRNAADSLDEPVDFIGVGVGAPNGNYKKGTIEDALTYHGLVRCLYQICLIKNLAACTAYQRRQRSGHG
ncbi:hypothetical protein [Reichenbachiella ulvae]|uniref:ROK family protein n=1 Tax=Reichenbachiella ulvae TaxID=2980104 RepID=A0ABT3D256_9BACT|nr:hypothetical protein [Reichenbachiella ulvae]MCV9389518.1 hypothetical protein [Reichenbachiella ulvae]